jgi:alkyl sulfatase BDS1-like metallo-beta-lactamase superfamily hydrolase
LWLAKAPNDYKERFMPADMSDRTDFDNANRGFMGRLSPGVIKTPDGRVVFDAEAFVTATTGNAPDTVHPSLWRQSQLTAIHGLFEVTDGIYQIRGMDLSNMTLVEGETGVIVIDPLISAECAAAGLALYREHRGDRPVTAVIYTHSHIDHFGGVLGVVDADTDVSIVAPEHFLDHSVSENVYAGGAMLRRGMYYAGAGLSIGTEGAVGIGLGSGSSSGTVGLIAPTLGSVSHNVKAIYQRSVGWYDGNPAHLWQHPPEAAGARYVEVIGGIDATVAKAEQFADQGDLRFAAELASHAVFADPNHAAARTVLAEVLTRLGHGSENATWRNCFLSGAAEIHGAEFRQMSRRPGWQQL